jgi:hypothetical protein
VEYRLRVEWCVSRMVASDISVYHLVHHQHLSAITTSSQPCGERHLHLPTLPSRT